MNFNETALFFKTNVFDAIEIKEIGANHSKTVHSIRARCAFQAIGNYCELDNDKLEQQQQTSTTATHHHYPVFQRQLLNIADMMRTNQRHCASVCHF